MNGRSGITEAEASDHKPRRASCSRVDVAHVENLAALTAPITARSIVRYLKSQTAHRVRTVSVVTVTNEASRPNAITVTWLDACHSGRQARASSSFVIPPGFAVTFGSRPVPCAVASVESAPHRSVHFDDGQAVISARLPQIAVQARLYWTSGEHDENLLAVAEREPAPFGSRKLFS